MNKIVSAVVCSLACIVANTNAKNYWKWDCESTSSATTAIKGFSGGSKLVTTDPHSGKYCLQHEAVGNDGGNQQAGAQVSGYDIGSLIDGKWLYYRWWMKIDANFKFGDSRGLIKASRVKSATESFSPPWTGFVAKKHIHVSECPGCEPKNYWDAGGPNIPFDVQAMAGKGWHEYIVAIKKQTGVSGKDGEFHLYVDGKEIGSGIKNLHWTNMSDPCNEAWVGWMVRPYFQLNGTSSDGGLIWIDDISTDDVWNSIVNKSSSGTTDDTTGSTGSTSGSTGSTPGSTGNTSGSNNGSTSGSTSGTIVNERDLWKNHPEWLWFDDFETTTNLKTNYQDVNTTGMTVSVKDAFEGKYSLNQNYQVGQQNAGWIVRYNETGFPNHVFMRWYHKFESGFDGFPPKMARIRNRSHSTWTSPFEVHCWIADGKIVSDIKATKSSQANSSGWLPIVKSDYSVSNNVGKWVCYEMEVQLNDPGKANGLCRIWADDNLIIERLNIDIRGNEKIPINEVMLDCYWNEKSPNIQNRYYDNFIISTKRIYRKAASTGTIGSGGSGSTGTPTKRITYWKWDCESVNSATTKINGFSGGSKLVTTDPHSGKYCLQHNAVGNDNGNQQAGAQVTAYDIGSLIDGQWFYYRWWMKLDKNFKFGNGRGLIKASRVKSASESFSPPWTGFVAKEHIHVSECPDCSPKNYWDAGGPKIPFNVQAMAGKGWHEYIVAIKKQTGLSGKDGEFHLYVDGKEIGSGIKNLHWTNKADPCKEAWVGWMVRPYFQLSGTTGDGGLMWIDDISTDNVWNSSMVSSLPKESVTTPVLPVEHISSRNPVTHSVNNKAVNFTVKLLQADNISLNLYDLYGRTVWSYSKNGQQGTNLISMNKCAPGNYILKINLEKSRFMESRMIEVLK
ncbi:MAG: T9SS type A sorting domain-containing protein [Fibrobacter sp.]|nr:T9SS type A sorting domain-containing protein [Fibrobacter sp.]